MKSLNKGHLGDIIKCPLFRGSVMGYMSLIEKRPVGIYIIYISMGHNYACVINREASCRYIYNVMY